MRQRLPTRLIVFLALLAAVSFQCGLYLEASHLSFLQRHPILTNLVSGITSFAVSAIFIALGFNWFVRMERTAVLKDQMALEVVKFAQQVERLAASIPSECYSSVPPRLAHTWYYFTKGLSYHVRMREPPFPVKRSRLVEYKKQFHILLDENVSSFTEIFEMPMTSKLVDRLKNVIGFADLVLPNDESDERAVFLAAVTTLVELTQELITELTRHRYVREFVFRYSYLIDRYPNISDSPISRSY